MSCGSWINNEEVPEPDSLIYIAKLAEDALRFEDMAAALKKYILLNKHLNNEGRNLFSVAYKNLVGAHRTSNRALGTIRKDQGESAALKEASENVAKDFESVCVEALQLLEDTLIPEENTPEGKVFYWKMLGDYYRYLTEVQTGEKREESTKKSCEAYEKATEEANASLSCGHPIRLGLALNYSVFHYETMSSAEKAREIAEDALANAIRELGEVIPQDKADTATILQLLRENLALWNSDREFQKNENGN